MDYIHSNPNVCATIIEDRGYIKDQCEHAYSSLVIRGKLNIVEDIQAKKRGLNVLLSHLEDHPESILKQNAVNDESYDKVAILRLRIDSVSGKQGTSPR
jgi:nitroimidazol reductase NimA-like FMN-containing flavoprotein (pyridoxamine 5'-phosphate oxidase superfamily)